MADYIKGTETNNEPHIEMDDDERQINICPKCGADLYEVGLVEAIAGGYAETEITFKNGEADIGLTYIQNCDEQWIICGECGGRINRSASQLIDAYVSRQDLPQTKGDTP